MLVQVRVQLCCCTSQTAIAFQPLAFDLPTFDLLCSSIAAAHGCVFSATRMVVTAASWLFCWDYNNNVSLRASA